MENKCNQCGKSAVGEYAGNPLCVDCFHKLSQASFMQQQILHNQLSWLAANLNFTEQALYAHTGGLLPLKSMPIPQPPSSGIYYTHSNIQITDSAVGVVNPGTLYTLNTSIDVMNGRGDRELATAITDLTQAILNGKDIENEVKKEIVELLKFVASEASVDKNSRNKSVLNQVIDRLCTLIPVAASAWTIWDKVQPLIRTIAE